MIYGVGTDLVDIEVELIQKYKSEIKEQKNIETYSRASKINLELFIDFFSSINLNSGLFFPKFQ